MQVKDIMTKKVFSVEPGDPIDYVVSIMLENKVHGVPVVKEGKLVGMVTETDFFSKDSVNFNLARYMELIGRNRIFGDASKEDRERIQKLIISTVADIMSTDRKTVFPDDDIEKLIGIFKETGHSRIPVIDKKDNLVGIITRADVIRTMKI